MLTFIIFPDVMIASTVHSCHISKFEHSDCLQRSNSNGLYWQRLVYRYFYLCLSFSLIILIGSTLMKANKLETCLTLLDYVLLVFLLWIRSSLSSTQNLILSQIKDSHQDSSIKLNKWKVVCHFPANLMFNHLQGDFSSLTSQDHAVTVLRDHSISF